ncbi:protein Shroom4-like [Ruditapes philippinarum]|uniref:protein Shroom4-like n=1 Tax=Ruditapes philippinarum TaxID=129788 RepID=UPI00295BBE40|nr:protein Shroom4-like [Ruditapes philippinarum]
MSGAEADISSDGETSFEDEDVPLPPSPLKEGTDEPFRVVLKGGSPWGFTLTNGMESKASVIINEIVDGGKAFDSGQLKVGDYLLQVNEVRCLNLQVAHELIDSAFRTLTLLVWRHIVQSTNPQAKYNTCLSPSNSDCAGGWAGQGGGYD